MEDYAWRIAGVTAGAWLLATAGAIWAIVVDGQLRTTPVSEVLANLALIANAVGALAGAALGCRYMRIR